MLDPSSVVRESEYARTPGDLAVLNRWRGKIDKLQSGGAGLTDDDRSAIANMARNFASVSQNTYDNTVSYYNDLAEESGIDPYHVTRYEEGRQSVKGAESKQSKGQPTSAKAGGDYKNRYGLE